MVRHLGAFVCKGLIPITKRGNKMNKYTWQSKQQAALDLLSAPTTEIDTLAKLRNTTGQVDNYIPYKSIDALQAPFK